MTQILQKAIMYVTITETMDHLGLMNVNESKYSEIISAAGEIFFKKKIRYKKNIKTYN